MVAFAEIVLQDSTLYNCTKSCHLTSACNPMDRMLISCLQWHRNEFESGCTGPALPPETFFLVVPLHFLALKAQLVVLVSAFVMVSTVWSVSYLLFFYSRCPPCAQQFVKVGGHVPPVPHGVGATGPLVVLFVDRSATVV